MIPIIAFGFISGLAASLSGWGIAQMRWRRAVYLQELERERREFEEFSNSGGEE